MFNSRFKKIVLTTVVAALLSSCNLAGVLKNQKNLFGRYYDGALNEKELKSFNPALAKAYTRVYRETNFKKPYIVGKCIADAVLSNLPRDAYQTFADWQVLVAGTKSPPSETDCCLSQMRRLNITIMIRMSSPISSPMQLPTPNLTI